MTAAGARAAFPAGPGDVLVFLPRRDVARYRRGRVIYDQGHPSAGLYQVVQGRVKACTVLEDGALAALGICGRDEFFGESGLLGLLGYPERATALDECAIAQWTRAEVETRIEHHPQLGMALMRVGVQRCLALQTRLESLANQKTPERVAGTILELAGRLGSPVEGGWFQMPPLTHQLIAEYVGTSREIVTFQMNHLRKLGYIAYSRQSIKVYAQPLEAHLKRAAQW